MFSAIVKFFSDVINFLYQGTVSIGFPSFALAIIAVTIIIKALMYPMMAKQMKSMMNMQEVQPKMAKLQERYKNNPEKLNEEMMKLYKEYDVNPMSGCLPLLIQMPILIGLYQAFREYQFTPVEHATFFWIPNLNNPDPFFILPILVGVTMFVQQKVSMAGQDAATAQNPMMKSMLYVMPPMIGVMSLQFPSGLCLYWALFSFLGILQQLVMNKQRDKHKAEMAARREQEKEEELRKKKEAITRKKAAKKREEVHEATIIEETSQGDAE